MEIILPSKIKIISENETSGVYEIEKLYPGYGHTLGNSLRRILFSSLEGAAITRVKIAGINHEFSTIPGVKEDALNIILNLKSLRLKLYGDEPQTITLREKGQKELRAKDFKIPSQVEIVNKDFPIAVLTSKNSALEIEAKIEKGIGYILKENLSKDKMEIGMIGLDALFSPVKIVSYEVENMRVGERTDFNKLKIKIDTDGTISPREALNKSLEIMIKQLGAIADFENVEEKIEKTEVEQEPEIKSEAEEENILLKPAEELNFSPRIQKAFKTRNIRTLGDLIQKNEAELLQFKGIGKEAIGQIKQVIGKHGFELKQ